MACVMTVSCGPVWPKYDKKAELNAFNSLWNPVRDIACRMQTLSHQFVSTNFHFSIQFYVSAFAEMYWVSLKSIPVKKSQKLSYHKYLARTDFLIQ